MVENQNQTLQSVGLKAGAFAAAGTGRESGQLILARGPGTLNAHTLTRSLALSFTSTSTEVKPAFGGQQVLEGDVTQANLRTQLAGGAVEVEVKLNAKLRVKVWAFKVPGPRARISCPLSLPAPGAAAGAPAFKPTDCKVWF
uniref:Late embryogenesis abundant protein LEA-2 subgroup domain-containing protein n=1 Tax=Aegilops tauschii subsp. strangulata TaxID=200361 RepID=A0A453DI50_AEGTS